MALHEQVAAAIRQHELIPAGSTVVVAVSGGADSVCLLHLLQDFASRSGGFDVVVAHLDHGLRPESPADADFVRAMCLRLRLPCVVERQDVALLADTISCGLEEAGREARRRFLGRLAEEYAPAVVALAHHRDDQAETVLMRAARGCGVSGLAAMRWRNGPFIRPLLAVSRQEIEDYLAERRLAWVEDGTNQQLCFERNRIRHCVMPSLQQYNGRAAAHLAALAERVALEETYWQEQVSHWFKCHAGTDGAGIRLEVDALRQCHPALRDRLIRQALQGARGDLKLIEAQHIRLVADHVLAATPQWQLDLPRAWVARRYDALLFRSAPPKLPVLVRLEVDACGSYVLPDGRELRVEQVDFSGDLGAWQAEFSVVSVPFPLCIRSVAPGDRIELAGMVGRKQVKKLFAEACWSVEQRRSALAVEAGGTILWLPGLRRSRHHYPEGGRAPVLRLSLSLPENKI